MPTDKAMREWPCEHITLWSDNRWGYGTKKSGWISPWILGDEMFCKHCGAKRPEPPKLLWERFRQSCDGAKGDGYLKCFAEEAVKAVEEQIEILAQHSNWPGQVVEALKARLRKELLGE